jgi:uncharacterized membrane protein YheB (UPF0754 family)
MMPENFTDLLPYFAIPFISSFIGWITNVIALKMTFYPLEYKGIRPFGWQGIIPSKSGIMAGKAVDLLTTNLLNVKEIFSRLDPARVAQEMDGEIKIVSRKIVDEVMEAHVPLVWVATPSIARNVIYEQASNDLPEVAEEMMEEIKTNITELFDVRGMVVASLLKDKALLNRIFQTSGEKEFKFIEHSGLYFGFLFGLIQMTVWYFYPQWWILPLAGLMVGYLTNWLALKLIFKPERERKFLWFRFQGLFIKRQKEVSREYAKIVTSNILTTPKIFEEIIRGNASDKLTDIVNNHVEHAVDEAAGVSGPVIKAAAGKKTWAAIKNIACYRFMEEMPLVIKGTFGYAEEALNLENTLREKMSNLPGPEFVGFLRPVFQEDEIKLILVGAILGGIAGLLQLYLLF